MKSREELMKSRQKLIKSQKSQQKLIKSQKSQQKLIKVHSSLHCVHSSLHENCHHQITFAKFNLKIYYPPPYEREVMKIYKNMKILEKP